MVAESTALTVVKRSDDDLVALAERLSKSTLLPKSMQGKMPDVLVTIMAGQEMGLAPMASLRAFHVIEGKPVISSDGMVALVISSGKAAYFDCVSESDASVTYETLRVGSKAPQRCTWTMEMARAAALHQKDNWRLYKRQMLGSRCRSELSRRVYPDVLMGCYSDDEGVGWREPSGAEPARPVESPRSDVIDAEFTETRAVPAPLNPAVPPLLAKIAAAATIEELKGYAAEFAAMKLGRPGMTEYDTVNDAYKARLQWIKAQPVPTSPRSSSDGVSGSVGPTSNGFVTQSDASTGEATTP